MNTTNLFVELIVIDTGALAWIVLLVLSVFGYRWVPFDVVLSLSALVPILSVTYVLGIVTDRIADLIFDATWRRRLLKRHYQVESLYFDDRRIIYTQAEKLAELIEYGRSRLRICRGWVFNGVLILVTANLFVWTQLSPPSLQVTASVFITLFLVVLIGALWITWRQITLNDLRQVREQAAFLRAEDTAPKPAEG